MARDVDRQRLAGPARFTAFLATPVMNLAFRRFLANLRRYTDQRFATASS